MVLVPSKIGTPFVILALRKYRLAMQRSKLSKA
jgi:hypothetical protein